MGVKKKVDSVIEKIGAALPGFNNPDPRASPEAVKARNDASRPVPNNTATTNTSKGSTVDTTYNQDGSVTRTVNGITRHFTKEEYDTFLAGTNPQGSVNSATRAKGQTPNVQEAIASENARRPGVNQQGVDEAISQIGQDVPVSTDQTDVGNLLTGQLLAGTAAAVGTGAVTGAIAGNIPGAIAGAGLALGNIISEEHQKAKETKKYSDSAQTVINSIIASAQAGQISPMEAVRQYNRELAFINNAERDLKILTQSDLRAFLSDAGEELAEIEAWKRQQPMIEQQLIAAIQTPQNVRGN